MSSLHDYYAARAPEYDAVYRKPERQADLSAIQTWLPPQFAGAQVLDIACGTGYWTQHIAAVAAQVEAIDAAAEPLQFAAQRVARHNVQFLRGDAYDLTGLDGVFDAGFAGFWFSHIPHSRVREFLCGFHAALEPGARVVLLDNRFVAASSSPISDCDAQGNTYQLRTLRDGSTHRVLKNFPDESQLRACVEDLAENVVYRQWDYFWALSYVTPRSRALRP